jgi:hypothetical protein
LSATTTKLPFPISKPFVERFFDGGQLPRLDFFTLPWKKMCIMVTTSLQVNFDHFYFQKSAIAKYFASGTTIIPNAWYVGLMLAVLILKFLFRAMSRDPLKYKNSEEFNPDRFFDEKKQLNDDDVPYTFGFGRRFVSDLSLESL